MEKQIQENEDGDTEEVTPLLQEAKDELSAEKVKLSAA